MGKAVFITGGQSNTGFGIASFFAKQGWDVFITALDEDEAQFAANELSSKYGVFAKGFQCDNCNEEQIINTFKEIDKLGKFVDAVVLNAADLGCGSDPAKGIDFFTAPINEFKKVLETNLVGNFMIVREAALRMKEKGKGSIVFISSNGSLRPIPNRAAYHTSKGGINAMSKTLAVDLGPYGIRCNTVLPGTIKTKRWESMGKNQIVNGSMTPLGDISDFEDVANAVWYFATDMSKNVTGAELVVDGGMSCQLYPTLLNELKAKASQNEAL